MRPEQQTIIPEILLSFSIFNANINCKHFKCCYHDADDNFKLYAIIMKMLTRALRIICHRGGDERGATETTTEKVPQQRNGNDATTTFR